MMASVPHVISGLGLRKFQADGSLLTRVYLKCEHPGLYKSFALNKGFSYAKVPFKTGFTVRILE